MVASFRYFEYAVAFPRLHTNNAGHRRAVVFIFNGCFHGIRAIWIGANVAVSTAITVGAKLAE